MEWAEAQEQKALGKIIKSGSISISVAPRGTTEVQRGPTPAKKRACDGLEGVESESDGLGFTWELVQC